MLPELALATVALAAAFIHQHLRLSHAMRRRITEAHAGRIAGPIRGVLYRDDDPRDWTKARAYNVTGIDRRR